MGKIQKSWQPDLISYLDFDYIKKENDLNYRYWRFSYLFLALCLGIRAKVVIFQDGRRYNDNNGEEMEIIEFLINPGFVNVLYNIWTETTRSDKILIWILSLNTKERSVAGCMVTVYISGELWRMFVIRARIGVITQNSAEIIRDYFKLCLDYLEILQGAILKSYQRSYIQYTLHRQSRHMKQTLNYFRIFFPVTSLRIILFLLFSLLTKII